MKNIERPGWVKPQSPHGGFLKGYCPPPLTSRVCTVCGVEKPIAEFADRRKKGAHDRGNCIPCYAEKTRVRLKAVDAARRTEEFRERRREYKASKPPSEMAKARARRKTKKANERYPEKNAARLAVRRAILTGDLVRPELCEGCHTPGKKRRDGKSALHGHHHDYSKPLEVQWLCPLCHSREHAKTLAAQPERKGE